MPAKLLEGKPVADALRPKIQSQVERFHQQTGRTPCIATLMVGDDEASVMYAKRVSRVHQSLGMLCKEVSLPSNASQEELEKALASLGSDEEIDGILPLLPFPEHIDWQSALSHLPPNKDVDGLHPENAGKLLLGMDTFVPNTPAGGIEILDYYGIELKGRRAVVVGRSNIVGKPMAVLLLSRHATVTVCHSRTEDLPSLVREADVLVAAVGKPRLIKGDWIKPGAVVIDFGINTTDGGVVGDVDFESAVQVASAITPVPGGTGPTTNLMLARNTVKAAYRNRRLAE